MSDAADPAIVATRPRTSGDLQSRGACPHVPDGFAFLLDTAPHADHRVTWSLAIDADSPGGWLWFDVLLVGQSTLHDWPERTRNEAELVGPLHRQRQAAPHQHCPASYSKWGGWTERRVEATGFFRTHHDGERWWLVDPEGHLFWSAGVDCVHPTIDHEVRYETRWMNLRPALRWLPDAAGPMGHALGRNPWHSADDREANFTVANFTRAFGRADWYFAWTEIAHAQFKRIGFNTVGNWSDEPAASRAALPYVRPLELGLQYETTPLISRGLPDMFHPNLTADLEVYARQLAPTRDDPAMLGYFLHNEPPWHFGDANPAEAMLATYESGPARAALADWLREKYHDDADLSSGWAMPATLSTVRAGRWRRSVTPAARSDLEMFSTAMIRRLCDALSAACRRVDSNHLNLGVRWWTFPPAWALRGMGSFDVISFNCYQPRMNMVHYGRREAESGIAELAAELNRPFLVGEWHFGALGAGLPSAGLYRTEDEAQRGRAYRYYLEHAAAEPWCVGAHWFNLYDRTAVYSAMSNENYHIGFLDIRHREHEAITRAARASHERLYNPSSTPRFRNHSNCHDLPRALIA